MSLAPFKMYGFSLLKLVKFFFFFLLFATGFITAVNKDYQKHLLEALVQYTYLPMINP